MARELRVLTPAETECVAPGDTATDNYCASCSALCCRAGVVMPLTEVEVDFMRAGGTDLEQVSEATRLDRLRSILHLGAATTQFYKLQTDCGYLRLNTASGQFDCTVHEDPQRSRICQDFIGGSYNCRVVRVQGGIDSVESLEAYDQRTRS